MNELTIDNMADAYRRALEKMKEPYRKVGQVQPPQPTVPAPQFIQPPPKLPQLSYTRPGFNNAL